MRRTRIYPLNPGVTGVEYAHKSTTQQQHTQMQRRERNHKMANLRLRKCAQISLKHFGGVAMKS
jgi:hypothetical protein